MKKGIVLIGILVGLFAQSAISCSCQPYIGNFFNNLNKVTPAGMLKIDSVWFISDSNSSLTTPYAKLRVIKVYRSNTIKAGDTLVYKGQDGINCNWGYEASWTGDTIISILGDSAITFWASTHCGTPAIRLQNGKFDGMNMDEIEALINQRLTSIAEYDGFDEISTSPNPAKDVVGINLPQSGIFSVDILTSNGNRVQRVNYLRGQSQIDLSALAAGMYILQISDGRKVKSIKVVKE